MELSDGKTQTIGYDIVRKEPANVGLAGSIEEEISQK